MEAWRGRVGVRGPVQSLLQQYRWEKTLYSWLSVAIVPNLGIQPMVHQKKKKKREKGVRGVCCEWGTQRSRRGPGLCGFQRKSACSGCPLEDWLGAAPARPSSTSAAQLLQEARPAQALRCPLEQTATFFCMENFGFKERDFIFIGL